jgi:ABC-type Na+ efflux pump permease subunit
MNRGQNRIVNNAILFALILVIIGMFVLGDTALFLFREAQRQHVAGLGFSIIILGIAGFAFG